MKKKDYEEAKLELICFGEQDIITASLPETPSGSGAIGGSKGNGWDKSGWT